MPTTTEVISSVNDILAAHTALIARVRATQIEFRQQLHAFQSPPYEILKLPIIPSPPSSPGLSERLSPPPSPTLKEQQHQRQLQRADLPPAKRARVLRYRNYVPRRKLSEMTTLRDMSTAENGRRTGSSGQTQNEDSKKLQSLGSSKFDVVLIDPPFSSSFTWDHLQELPIPLLAAEPSFIFLWIGSGAGEGLDAGERCSRSGDIGDVKTSYGSKQTRQLTEVPGYRRLELFGRVPTSFRRGWVTVLSPGHEDRLPASKNDSGSIKVETEDGGTVDLTRWDRDKWEHGIQQIAEGGKAVVPTTPDIDTLRPKSPFRPGQGHQMPVGRPRVACRRKDDGGGG
ncbi:MT-A70-domain-containing protein [Salix suchowensis]|nr:MT-A70-domain-containing protein [Salix suchowensis]